MNDIGYTKEQFKGSIAYNCIMAASERGLMERANKRYAENAIEYHIKECNPITEKFFRDELKLINKRLKQLQK